MKKKSCVAVSLLLTISAFLSACSSSSSTTNSSPAAKEPAPAASSTNNGGANKSDAGKGGAIKLATQTPLSGENAEMGEDIKLGAEMAVKDQAEKFKSMGFDLQLLPKDDKADPATGTTNAKALVSDQDVLAMVGHLNSGVLAAAGVTYEGGGLPYVVPGATNPGLSKNGWKTFHRVCGVDSDQGPAGAKFIADQGKKKVFVLDDGTDYGKGLADAMDKKAKEIGLNIVGHEAVSAQEMEFNTIATKVKALGADVVYFGGMYAQAGQFLKQLADKHFDGLFVSADGANNEQFVKAAGSDNVKHAYITSVIGDISATEEGKKWVAKYKQSFGKDPGAFAAYGYDAALVALHGIEEAIKNNGGKKPTREQVNAEITKTNNFKGILTVTTFDDHGENKNAVGYIYSFEKGTYPPILIGEIK